MKRLIPSFFVCFLVGCGGEPEVQGQPLSIWMGALDNPEQQATASQVLTDSVAQHKVIVPQLVAAVKRGSYAACDTLGKIGPPGIGDQMKNVVAALAEAVRAKKNQSL